MNFLTREDIKKINKKDQLRLIKLGFNRLNSLVTDTPYYHLVNPEDCYTWHRVMDDIERED